MINKNPYIRRGKGVLEHRLIAERILGRPLPQRVEIHHPYAQNNNKCFVICENRKYHALLHQRSRALKECGHVAWRKCAYCKMYDKSENLQYHDTHGRHKECHSAYEFNRKLLKHSVKADNTSVKVCTRCSKKSERLMLVHLKGPKRVWSPEIYQICKQCRIDLNGRWKHSTIDQRNCSAPDRDVGTHT